MKKKKEKNIEGTRTIFIRLEKEFWRRNSLAVILLGVVTISAIFVYLNDQNDYFPFLNENKAKKVTFENIGEIINESATVANEMQVQKQNLIKAQKKNLDFSDIIIDEKLIELKEREKINLQDKEKFQTKTGITPFSPTDYLAQIETTNYATVDLIVAKHKTKDIKLTTLITKDELTVEDYDEASYRLFGIGAEFFEPVTDHGVTNPNLKDVQVFGVEGDYSAFVIKAKSLDDKNIIFAIDGTGLDVTSEVDKLRTELNNLNISATGKN